MNVIFVHNKTDRELKLRDSFRLGMLRHKDAFQAVTDIDAAAFDWDVVAFVGLKGHAIRDRCMRSGKRFLYLDKGYYYPEEDYASKAVKQARNVHCWRISVDTTQPLEYLNEARHTIGRWDKFGPRPKPWRDSGPNAPIVIAGSSEKYHQFNGLPHPTQYAEQIVAELRKHTDRPIYYRPKPSWGKATPIAGTEMKNTGSFEEVSAGAHAVITHGSNAALIAMLSGIPSIITGNGVMMLISSTELSDIEEPRLASEEERLQLLANVAWSQYTLNEFAKGTAWEYIKTLLLA